MKIAYFGVPLGALELLRHGFQLSSIVLRPRGMPGLWRLRRTKRNETLLLVEPDLARPEVEHALLSAQPDVVLSWFYSHRIPEPYLNLGLGAWGFHPSLLPRWRGPDPYFWALRNGDTESGVTVHQLAAEYDAGEIAFAQQIPIAPTDNAVTLSRKLDRVALALLVQSATQLQEGLVFPTTTQRESDIRFAPLPSDEDLQVDWRLPAYELECLVRAASPRPGAFATLGDSEVDILEAYVAPGARILHALKAGEAVCTEDGVVVKTGSGGLLVQKVRLADGRHVRAKDLHALFARG